MSTKEEIRASLLSDDIPCTYVDIDKHDTLYGESATKVQVFLADGRTVEGKFTTELKDAFGGVTFSSKKDIPALMIAKVRSVWVGTSDTNE